MEFSNLTSVPLDSIDSADKRYLVTTDADTGDKRPDLTDSIRQMGLLAPPLLAESDGRFIIISGFRRIAACRSLEYDTIDVFVKKSISTKAGELDFECAKAAIADNSLQRSLNLIEMSRAFCMIDSFVSDIKALSHIAGILGLPVGYGIIKKIKKIASMPQLIQNAILTGSISLPVAILLESYQEIAKIAFARLFISIKFSLNKQREILTLVKEIGRREGIDETEILLRGKVQQITENPDLDANKKGQKIREYLKQRRYPALQKAQKIYEDNVNVLNLADNVRLSPPAHFEGNVFALNLSFQDPEQLKACLKNAGELVDNPIFEKILLKTNT